MILGFDRRGRGLRIIKGRCQQLACGTTVAFVGVKRMLGGSVGKEVVLAWIHAPIFQEAL